MAGSGFAARSHIKGTELTVRPAGKICGFQLVFTLQAGTSQNSQYRQHSNIRMFLTALKM